MKRLLLSIFLILFLPLVSNAATIWFNPSSGSEGVPDYSTKNTGYHSLASAIAALSNGDTLYFADDTYTASSSGWDIETSTALWPVSVSGGSGSHKVFRAETDGAVILDAEDARGPLIISSKNYLDFHGFVFKNSNRSVVDVDSSTYLNFYRCSAYNTPSTDDHNFHVWDFNLTSYILLEDCVGGGTTDRRGGRVVFQPYKSHHVTFRRCFGYHRDYLDTVLPYRGGAIFQIYDVHDAIIENNVGTFIVGTGDHWINGISVYGKDTDYAAYNVDILGNVMYELDQGASLGNLKSFALVSRDNAGAGYNNTFVNNVSIDGPPRGFEIGGDNYDWGDGTYGTKFLNNTIYSSSKITSGSASRQGMVVTGEESPTTAAVIKDSIFDTGITGLNGYNVTIYNDFIDIYNYTNDYTNGASAGDDDENIDPAWDTSTFGYGAYLMHPDALSTEGSGAGPMGAEVLYRYEDGVLGSTALWPWPMEARIWAELSVSVTYSESQGAGENGGIWKTIDGLYDTITDPDPINGATDVALGKILTWTNGLECTGNGVDVFFDAVDGSTPVITNDPCTTESYNPGGMDPYETYYWEARNNDTSGTVISFTTGGPPPSPLSQILIKREPNGVVIKRESKGVSIENRN